MNVKPIYENIEREQITAIGVIKLIQVAPIEVIGGDINTMK